MDLEKKSLDLHLSAKGKIEVISRVPLKDRADLSLAYTPGVAAPCMAIKENPARSYELTRRGNLVAVITDGTAVLGLGDIGPEAAMPVMEGKCVLFKEFGGVDAIPLCLATKDTDELVKTIALLAPSFGGINLEDIAAPRCFEVERRLKELLPIPVFHDDQHGTAIVAGAALENALKVVGKRIEVVRVVISGAGSAGLAIARFLLSMGVRDLVICDSKGILTEGDPRLNPEKQEMARLTNRAHLTGSIAGAMKGADVFIGVSAPKSITGEMVASMNKGAIVFALANPTPEILPEEARAAGAAVVGTGRSDFDNQINNVLAFPGIFRGALDVRASDINDQMKLAAAKAIAGLIEEGELSTEYIIPKALDRRVGPAVREAVAEAARASGVSRV